MVCVKVNLDRTACRVRTGTVYIAVLGVAMIVGVIGICSLHVARLQVQETMALSDMASARLAARSGIECGLAKLQSDNGWRTNFSSGIANLVSNLTGILSGDTSFEFTYVDADGDLNDDHDDAVTLRAVGTSQRARHVIEVLLMPTGLGVSSLTASMHSHDSLEVKSALSTNQTISSNGNIKIDGGSVAGNVQSAGTIQGTPTGTKTENMTPQLELPDLDDVFEYYLSNGTPLSIADLPGGKIERCVLSAGANPYGTQTTNSQGIYVVDCHGNKVTIRDCRIRATVVFVNASTVEVDGSIVWESHVPHFPALMVQGNLDLKWDSTSPLSEGSLNINFNPLHTPHTTGTDTDRTDTYMGAMSGLYYATGDLHVSGNSNIKGVVVVGETARIEGMTSIAYDSTYYLNAPPGFSTGTDLEIVPGTWKQVAY